jgi:hypothetical protein
VQGAIRLCMELADREHGTPRAAEALFRIARKELLVHTGDGVAIAVLGWFPSR